MSCSKINTSHLSSHSKLHSNPIPSYCLRSSIPFRIDLKTRSQIRSSYTHSDEETADKVAQNLSTVKFETLESCKLGISIYPDFEYNAKGGHGTGLVVGGDEDLKNGDLFVSFDVNELYIPPLNSATTKFLGLPLPPFLKIDIVPEIFQGTINKDSGKVELKFKSKFLFSVGSIYRAPALGVDTILTSEESQGTMRKGVGKRLNANGECTLVGVATVDPIDDILMNSFLGLPTECIAVLKAIIIIN